MSDFSLGISKIMKIRSNLESKDGERLIFSIIDLVGSYLECSGLAAANIAVLEFNWQTIPALAIEIVCCYIAYSRTLRELSSILSN